MRINVLFATICPWCFLGKRRLELLVRQQQHLNFEINWHPYFLNPEMPPEGIKYQEFLRNKYGHKIQIEKFHNTINQMAKSLNLKFNFSKIIQIPNSLDSHRLIKLANRKNKGAEMLDSLYQNYFMMGKILVIAPFL